jgi:hypothetical protein
VLLDRVVSKTKATQFRKIFRYSRQQGTFHFTGSCSLSSCSDLLDKIICGLFPGVRGGADPSVR